MAERCASCELPVADEADWSRIKPGGDHYDCQLDWCGADLCWDSPGCSRKPDKALADAVEAVRRGQAFRPGDVKPAIRNQTRHVVLAQPGDVLILAGVGDLDLDAVDTVSRFFADVGIKTAMFPDAVDMGVLEEWQVEFLREAADG